MNAAEYMELFEKAERKRADNTRTAKQESQPEGVEADPETVERLAGFLRHGLFPASLQDISHGSALASVPMESYQQFVESFVADVAGDACHRNPTLRLLIEQLMLAHHMICRLQSDAVRASEVETQRVKVQLATNLTGELRRLTKDIEEQCDKHRSQRFQVTPPQPKKKGGAMKRTG